MLLLARTYYSGAILVMLSTIQAPGPSLPPHFVMGACTNHVCACAAATTLRAGPNSEAALYFGEANRWPQAPAGRALHQYLFQLALEYH